MPTPCIRSARRLAVCLLVFVCLGLLPAWAQAAKRTHAAPDASSARRAAVDYAPGEVLVTFEPELGEFQAAVVLDEAGRAMSRAADFAFAAQDAVRVAPSHRGQTRAGAHRYLVHTPMDARRAAQVLASQPGVVSASPNYRRRATTVEPGDPYWTGGSLWNLSTIAAAAGWAQANPDQTEVVIAVLDTGVDYTHEDLAGIMWVNAAEAGGDPGVDDDENGYVDDIYGWEQRTIPDPYEVVTEGDPMDNNGHGTHVAGIAAAQANNGVGIPGVAFPANVKIMALKFLDYQGWGYDSDAIALIDYAIQMKQDGVNIVAINASWGGAGYNPALEQAISEAGAAGIIFVAAAGNQGFNNDCEPHYPGSYPLGNVVSVAASDESDLLSVYDVESGVHSNYGLVAVDLAAPGSNIISSYPGAIGLEPQDLNGNLYEDFSSALDPNWLAAGNWTRAEANEPVHGTWSLMNLSAEGYLNNMDESVTWTVNEDLSGGEYRLVYSAKIDLEPDYDFLRLEFTKDDGLNWEVMQGLSGYTEDWVSYSVPITEPYLAGNFRFRFRMVTDYSNPALFTGAAIDAVALVPASVSDTYEQLSGTSMATPHVSGTLALLSAMDPNMSMTEKIGRLLGGCSYPPSQDNPLDLVATTGAGGRLNLEDALDLSASPAPVLVSASRWNGDAAHPEMAVEQGDALVLTGGGFGSIQGLVLFSHGNAAGDVSAQITSWSDTQIVCTVPENAGSHVRVVNAMDKVSGKQRISSWQEMAPMITPRDTFASASLDGKVYALGGMDNGAYDEYGDIEVWDSVEFYDPATSSWNAVDTAMDPARGSHAVAAYDGKLYTFGGYSHAVEYLNTVQSYDPASGQWASHMDMPTALMWHAVAVASGKIWLTGGAYDDNGEKAQSNAVYSFTPGSGGTPESWATWSSYPMLEARESHAMVAVGTKLYVFGGAHRVVTNPDTGESQLVVLDTCEVLDTANLAPGWQELPPMPRPMARMAAATDGAKIYLAGGTDNEWWHGTPSRHVLVFDLATQTWEESADYSMGDAREARNAPCMAYLPGQGLFLMGGLRGGEAVTSCELFTIESPAAEPEESDILMFIPGIIAASHR